MLYIGNGQIEGFTQVKRIRRLKLHNGKVFYKYKGEINKGPVKEKRKITYRFRLSPSSLVQ